MLDFHSDAARMRGRIGALALAAMSLAACQQHVANTTNVAPAAAAASCTASAHELASAPGAAWLKEHGWRFRTAEEASAAYAALVRDASPWPDWYTPQEVVLPVGTRFQMALASNQPSDQPGGFGTFDLVDEVADVRQGLAVREEWKPDVARVVTYEVVKPLPAKVGPVGPQVDPGSCRLLPGRWSQLEMTVPREQRIEHLTIVDERPIQ